MIASLSCRPLMFGACLAGGLLAALPASAQSVRLLGDYNAWSAYTTGEGASKMCFAMTRPTSTEPTPDGMGDAYVYVTHRQGEGVRSEFNLVAGYSFATDSRATASVSGASFALFTSGDSAWVDDMGQSEALVAAVRAGNTLVVEGTTERGIRVRQSFSLAGATAAGRAIDAEC